MGRRARAGTKKPPPRPSSSAPAKVVRNRAKNVITAPPDESAKRGTVVKRRELAGVIYQLEWIRCGTPTCHCMRDPSSNGHGPYWYAYRVGKGGRWRSSYVGRKFAPLEN